MSWVSVQERHRRRFVRVVRTLCAERQRLDGSSEYDHAKRVMEAVAPYVDEAGRLAALGHDLLEDDLLGRHKLRELSGRDPTRMIEALSRPCLPRPLRDIVYHARLRVAARRYPAVAISKLADALDNVRSSHVYSLGKRLRKLREATRVFLPLARRYFPDCPLIAIAEQEFEYERQVLARLQCESRKRAPVQEWT